MAVLPMNRSRVGCFRSPLHWWGRASLGVSACLVVLVLLPWPAYGATLQELFNGAVLDAGKCRFSNWELISSDSTAAIPNLSQITVLPLTNDLSNPGLQFSAGSQLSTAGVNSIDLLFRFRVQVLAGGNTLVGHTLAMTGISFGGNGGIAYISDELANGVGAQLVPVVVIADNETDVFQFTNTANVPPQPGIRVTTNIFITGLAGSDIISLSAFTQRFAQTGPVGVPGDYNQNGTIDAADYTVWRNKLGSPPGSLPNDIDGGVIGLAQFNTWKAYFGTAGSAALAASPQVAVPEPASALWTIVTAMTICLCRRGSTR